MIYVMSCGCEVGRENVKTVKATYNGKMATRLRCMACDKMGIVVEKKNTCIKCGVVFNVSCRSGRASEICQKCAFVPENDG